MTIVIVFVHSLGSLWQHKDVSGGGIRIWNTTGVAEGSRVRSYARTFGQLQFGPKVRPFLHRQNGIAGALWAAGETIEIGSARKLRLFCRASKNANPDWHLVVFTEALVGNVEIEGIDPLNAMVLSVSQKNGRQELMLLVRPFAWISGSIGSAVWSPTATAFNWSITGW